MKLNIPLYQDDSTYRLYQHIGIINPNPLGFADFFLKHRHLVAPIFYDKDHYENPRPPYSTSFFPDPNPNSSTSLNAYYDILDNEYIITYKTFSITPYELYTDPANPIDQMIEDPEDPDNYILLRYILDFSKYRYSNFWYGIFCIPQPLYPPKNANKLLVCLNLETNFHKLIYKET